MGLVMTVLGLLTDLLPAMAKMVKGVVTDEDVVPLVDLVDMGPVTFIIIPPLPLPFLPTVGDTVGKGVVGATEGAALKLGPAVAVGGVGLGVTGLGVMGLTVFLPLLLLLFIMPLPIIMAIINCRSFGSDDASGKDGVS